MCVTGEQQFIQILFNLADITSFPNRSIRNNERICRPALQDCTADERFLSKRNRNPKYGAGGSLNPPNQIFSAQRQEAVGDDADIIGPFLSLLPPSQFFGMEINDLC
jgi:hypothetical protein